MSDSRRFVSALSPTRVGRLANGNLYRTRGGRFVYAQLHESRWILHDLRRPLANDLEVRNDGSVWAGDDFSRPLPDNFNDDDAYPYEGEVTLCASCAFPTESGKPPRHARGCPKR